MATAKKRKVAFYFITFQSTLEVELDQLLKGLLAHITAKRKNTRKYDIHSKKFFLLDSLSSNNDTQKLTLKSASHSFRAPLIDRNTADERDNPKTITEGEVEKTHGVIKYMNDDVLLILEKYRGSVKPEHFVNYLNRFLESFETNLFQAGGRFFYEILVKENFLQELRNMPRVLSTTVYADKRILGGEALNFSDRTTEIQDVVQVEIKAKRRQSMKRAAVDIYSKLNGGTYEISKIRIKGKTESNNDITIDTSFIEKREYVVATLNEDTGEVNSNSILAQLILISNSN